MNEELPAAAEGTMKPFYGRVLVIPSDVDASQRPSGLILPTRYEGDDGVARGVVIGIDSLHVEQVDSAEQLQPGTVVYYRGGVFLGVGDYVVLDRQDIYAFEA